MISDLLIARGSRRLLSFRPSEKDSLVALNRYLPPPEFNTSVCNLNAHVAVITVLLHVIAVFSVF